MYHNDVTPDNLVMLHDAHVRPWQFSVIALGASSLETEVPPQYYVPRLLLYMHFTSTQCLASDTYWEAATSTATCPAASKFHMVLYQPHAVSVASRMEAGCTDQCCCTALQEVPRLAKLAFISNDILRTSCPRRLSDVQSLLFSCVAASGMKLPWTEATNGRDAQKVRELRHLALREGASAPLLGRLSPLLRSFAGEYLPSQSAPTWMELHRAAYARQWDTLSTAAPTVLPSEGGVAGHSHHCCCFPYRGGVLQGGTMEPRWSPAGGLGSASAQAGTQVTLACHIAVEPRWSLAGDLGLASPQLASR